MPLPNVVLFRGLNASDQPGLWETNGFASGTFESVASLAPSNLTVFNGEVLFESVDGNGHFGLWTTKNGNPGSVMELTGITDINDQPVSNLRPNSLIVFNGEVLFNGTDAAGHAELWMTNGTGLGTTELGSITGAATTGLDPSDLTLFQNKVLFNGDDSRSTPSQPAAGLWVTNGTVAGTHELVQGGGPSGLNPQDMTVFGAEVLFQGTNASGHVGLFETDGTTASEIVPSAGANALGLFPSQITVLGGKALFSGLDSGQNTGLWVTNGTGGSGTQELTGISGAAADFDPLFLTAYNGEVFFNGVDSTGKQGLWETDGTAAGTHEIFAGAGDPSGLDPSGFSIYDNELLFSGKDASGLSQLWETNGTTVIEVTGVPGAPTQALAPLGLTAIGLPVLTAGADAIFVIGSGAVKLDPELIISGSAPLTEATVKISAGFHSGDALAVGLPQSGISASYDSTTGVLTLSAPTGASVASFQTELDSITFASTSGGSSSRTISWSVSGAAGASAPATSSVGVFINNPDLNIRLQNASGPLALWQTDGATLLASGLLGPNPGSSWLDMGTGAFFGGGASDSSDILLQNTNGSVAVWQMQGPTFVSSNSVANPGPNWRVEGTGDFNGDTKSDIALQNNNGAVAVWEMSNGQITTAASVANPGAAWHVETTGNFDVDNKSDIVLQNNSGNVAIWNMDGDQISQSVAVGNPGAAWHVVGTGKFNSDDQTDLLLQNNNGSVAIWEMNGDQLSQSVMVANPGVNWHVVSTGDFNQDSTTDIVLQNNNGAVAVWDMNDNATIMGSSTIANPGSAWSVIGNGRHG